MIYTDCRFLDQQTVEISWGWPVVSSEVTFSDSRAGAESIELLSSDDVNTSARVVDKSVTHAVIQYMEDGQHKKVTAKKSPFIYKG